MDFIFSLISISMFLAMFGLARDWLMSSSDPDDQGGFE